MVVFVHVCVAPFVGALVRYCTQGAGKLASKGKGKKRPLAVAKVKGRSDRDWKGKGDWQQGKKQRQSSWGDWNTGSNRW